MSKKRITFIVIPPNDRQIQEFRFSTGLLWLAGFVAVAFACAFGYFSTGYLDREDQHAQVARLNEENADLSQGLDRTRKQVEELELAMGELARDDERLRYLHEMPSLSAEDREPGMGGGEDIPEGQYSVLPDRKRELLGSLAGRIQRLRFQVKQQVESFAKISREYLLNGDSLRIIPSISPVSSEWTYKSSAFGKRDDPFTGVPARHLGIDIAGRRGTPVVATADGVIIYAYKQDIRLGNVVVIRHEAEGERSGEPYKVPGKYRTEYGHLDDILVKKGDMVKRGDQIGTMGNTGRSTAPHLHYGVRYQDRRKRSNKGYLDPEDFLLDWPRDTTVSGYLTKAED